MTVTVVHAVLAVDGKVSQGVAFVGLTGLAIDAEDFQACVPGEFVVILPAAVTPAGCPVACSSRARRSTRTESSVRMVARVSAVGHEGRFCKLPQAGGWQPPRPGRCTHARQARRCLSGSAT